MSTQNVLRPPSRNEMKEVLTLCKKNEWATVLQLVKKNVLIGTATVPMSNHMLTTVCHQALTSNSDIQPRTEVILQILQQTPEAAAIKNGYGTLCLHAVCQRNLKCDAKTKERLVLALIDAFPGALLQGGGAGMRTPLHIIFTGTSENLISIAKKSHLNRKRQTMSL